MNEEKLTWANVKVHYKEVSYWVATVLFVLVNNILLPYIVFSYLLHGLMGTPSPWIPIVIVVLVLFVTSISIYKDILKIAHTHGHL